MKVEQLFILRNMRDLLYNPEPEDYRKCELFNIRLRNEEINHFANGNPKLPLLQIVPPANIYALCNDHTYDGALEDKFLGRINVEKISDNEVLEIEKKTRGQAATKALPKVWGEERTERLNSSMFGQICKRTSATDGDKLGNTLTTRSNIGSKATNH